MNFLMTKHKNFNSPIDFKVYLKFLQLRQTWDRTFIFCCETLRRVFRAGNQVVRMENLFEPALRKKIAF